MLPNEENTVNGDEERVVEKVEAVAASELKPIVKATDTLPAAHTNQFVSRRGD